MASEFAGQLISLTLLLAGAHMVGWAFRKLKQPSVIGEVIAGVLLGPSLLGWVHPSEILEFTSELGAVFLLLLVGVETRLRDILEVGTEAASVAVLGVVLPFAAGTAFGLWAGFALVPALFLGTALVATSVGITARVLQELGALSRPYSRVILGAAVIDDVLGLVVLAVVSGVAVAGVVEFTAVGILIASSAAFVAGSAVAVPFMKRLPMDKIPFRTPLAFGVVLGVGMAALSAKIGLAPIVGAFFAGMLLAEIKDDHDVEEPINGIVTLLTPVFFGVVGLRLDLIALVDPTTLLIGSMLSILAIVGKFLAGLGAFKRGTKEASVIGMGMVPRGEVGLIVAAIGLSSGAVDAGEYAIVLFVVVVTTLLAPLLLRPMIQNLESSRGLDEPPPMATPDAPDEPA